jgi:hypothetical protein
VMCPLRWARGSAEPAPSRVTRLGLASFTRPPGMCSLCSISTMTGDNRRSAEAVAHNLGIECVFAEERLEQKADYVRRLQEVADHGQHTAAR